MQKQRNTLHARTKRNYQCEIERRGNIVETLSNYKLYPCCNRNHVMSCLIIIKQITDLIEAQGYQFRPTSNFIHIFYVYQVTNFE